MMPMAHAFTDFPEPLSHPPAPCLATASEKPMPSSACTVPCCGTKLDREASKNR